ncbi:hypothetical protein HPSH_02990 [Helicobacter pylori Shi470]|nr:hypothetical protein HPSH_02990 [Helicobacter pylori Shi470]
MSMLKISLWKMGRDWSNMTIFLWIKKAQIGERFPEYATPNKNHELVDYVMVDRNGNVIPGTLTQSKFVGRNGAECFEKFLSKDYEKYFENGIRMEIPKDFFWVFSKKG